MDGCRRIHGGFHGMRDVWMMDGMDNGPWFNSRCSNAALGCIFLARHKRIQRHRVHNISLEPLLEHLYFPAVLWKDFGLVITKSCPALLSFGFRLDLHFD